MGNFGAAADKATKKAEDTGESDDHSRAASLHEKASKAAFKKGDAGEGKRHAQAARKHRSKGTDSSSTESSNEGNPLLEWSKAH